MAEIEFPVVVAMCKYFNVDLCDLLYIEEK
jgi:hypothetical protein